MRPKTLSRKLDFGVIRSASVVNLALSQPIGRARMTHNVRQEIHYARIKPQASNPKPDQEILQPRKSTWSWILECSSKLLIGAASTIARIANPRHSRLTIGVKQAWRVRKWVRFPGATVRALPLHVFDAQCGMLGLHGSENGFVLSFFTCWWESPRIDGNEREWWICQVDSARCCFWRFWHGGWMKNPWIPVNSYEFPWISMNFHEWVAVDRRAGMMGKEDDEKSGNEGRHGEGGAKAEIHRR
jgi:hypothetical protein